jgi:hypothetical protein
MERFRGQCYSRLRDRVIKIIKMAMWGTLYSLHAAEYSILKINIIWSEAVHIQYTFYYKMSKPLHSVLV